MGHIFLLKTFKLIINITNGFLTKAVLVIITGICDIITCFTVRFETGFMIFELGLVDGFMSIFASIHGTGFISGFNKGCIFSNECVGQVFCVCSFGRSQNILPWPCSLDVPLIVQEHKKGSCSSCCS